MNILLIAGHGNGDPGACGCGYQEANETRRMANVLKQKLERRGINVIMYDQNKNAYDTVRYGGALPLQGIDYVIELHLNAGVGDTSGNGYTTGTEVLIHASEPGSTVEECILSKICALGFTNRGVKRRGDLAVMGYVVSNGISHALIETCFIDDADDMMLYEKNFDAIAGAIAAGVAKGFGLETEEEMQFTKEEAAWLKQLYAKSKETTASDWAADVVKEAKKDGIMDGSRPRDVCTREEAVAMIVRATKE